MSKKVKFQKSANFHPESTVFDVASTTEAYCGHIRYSIEYSLKFFMFLYSTYEIFTIFKKLVSVEACFLPHRYRYRDVVRLRRKQGRWHVFSSE